MTQQTPSTETAGSTAQRQASGIYIREFDAATAELKRTIRIPVKVFRIATSLVPHRVREEMAKEGFDLDGIMQAAREIDAPATLVEVDDHEKGRRIVVSLE